MPNITIVWATWAVWKEILNCLHDKNIKINKLNLIASKKSAWNIQKTPYWNIKLTELNDNSFKDIDFSFFCAGWEISKNWAKKAVSAWTIVIDNSSFFRYDDSVPLIVPEINAIDIWKSNLIANPNCTTAIATVALYPIHKKYKIKKAIISTYQATSWAWAKWMDELLNNTRAYIDWKKIKNNIFAHPIEFNLIPHIDSFVDNWYTKEEMKVALETKKIFWDDEISISCTAVRIPTLRAHSESIVLETEYDINPEDVKKIISHSPWVELVDDIGNNIYPMPLTASGKYNVEVWRIRQSLVFWKKWIELFVSWDQLLKWAALNAVQIMEVIIQNNFNN